MNEGLIIHGARLREIIRDDLQRALSLEKIEASEHAEFYLVNLLNDYHMAGRLPGIDEEERPLGVRFMEAMSMDGSSKARSLKQIGDGTLLALGLFAENLRRSIVSTSYYVTIGGSAYETLSGVLVCDPLFAEVYAELASKFASLVDALGRISPCNRASSNTELLSIYRRWRESGDERLGQILEQEGLLSREN
ncbi:MAG: hypothetical protein WC956_00735 [bacterium]